MRVRYRGTTVREQMKRLFLSLLFMCVAAQAASVPSVSLEELVDQSEAIVHGRVARSWQPGTVRTSIFGRIT